MTMMNHTPRRVGRPYADFSPADVDQAEPLDFPEDTAPAHPTRRITISATIAHRGRQLVISSQGYSADELCDLLDRRFGTPHVTQSPAPASAGAPSCPVHQKPMKPMTHSDKQGHLFWCTQKSGENYCPERA